MTESYFETSRVFVTFLLNLKFSKTFLKRVSNFWDVGDKNLSFHKIFHPHNFKLFFFLNSIDEYQYEFCWKQKKNHFS